jgi:WD40 repeat protein
MRIWDTTTGEIVVRPEPPPGGWDDFQDVAFSPDGLWLAGRRGFGKGAVHIWDARTGALVRTIETKAESTGGPAYSPAGDRLAVGRGGRVTEYDAATGVELRSLTAPVGTAGDVAYSLDGTWLAAAVNRPGRAGDIVVWSRATGSIAFTLRGHTDPVLSIAFSPDSRRLAASVGGYGAQIESPSMVRVWELTTGQEVLGVIGGYKSVQKVAFSPDGHRLACAGFDAVRIWDATPRADAGGPPAK